MSIVCTYRYFETIPGAKEKVNYPFGYGLSYTTFKLWGLSSSEEEGTITVTMHVTNTGEIAAKKCSVSITCILERKVNRSWVRVTSWTQTNENASHVMISKSVTVPSGYYYRVRSHHYAATDSATSYTNALWIG